VLGLASLAWATGDRAQGYAVAWYGKNIGTRLFPPERMVDLAVYLRELEASLSAEDLEIVREALQDPTRGIRLRTLGA
jgi:dienelactone hydrolase